MNNHPTSITIHLCVKNLRHTRYDEDPCLDMNNAEYNLKYPDLIEMPLKVKNETYFVTK
jgi:hypothetical protein